MSRANYSLSDNDTSAFKRLKEIFLNQKFFDNEDIANEIDISTSIESPTEEGQSNFTIIQLERQESKIEENLRLNYFPKSHQKHIDFVIFYKETTETQNSKEIKKFRTKFFKKLKHEGFDLYYIKQRDCDDDKIMYVYVLLNCPLDRLMDEAERMALELPLILCGLYISNTNSSNTNCLKKIQKYFDRRELKENKVCAPFAKDIRYIFQNFEEDITKSKGFTNTIRSLLVNNILENINMNFKIKSEENVNEFISKDIIEAGLIDTGADTVSCISSTMSLSSSSAVDLKDINDKIRFKNYFKVSTGLPYMLSKHYLDDAFIIHDETFVFDKTNDYILGLIDKKTSIENTKKNKGIKDMRSELSKEWAEFKNIIRFQPLMKIRAYFGETVALYFAWLGTVISSLWLISVIGVIFFFIGLYNSITNQSALQVSNNVTTVENLATYGNYYLNTFADSFDNGLTPYYAVIICLWGIFLSQYWYKENEKLSHEWQTTNYHYMESNRVEYTRKVQLIKIKESNMGEAIHSYPRCRQYLKYSVSFLILILMIVIVALDVALVVVFRIYMKTKVFPNNVASQIIIGDIGSTLLNLIAIILMDSFYVYVAKKLTLWEVPRTHTEYNNLLVLKLFVFEFVNCYGSLFYIAFFRRIKFENGLFNLGPDFQDSCSGDNCMGLLTIQVFVILFFKPFARFFVGVVWPVFYTRYQQLKFKNKYEKFFEKLNGPDNNVQTDEDEEYNTMRLLKKDFHLFVNLTLERKKPKLGRNIQREYMEKVIMYGYVMLFACSFSLGPLLFLISILIDLRIDAKSILWIYRRPVAHRTQKIGMFYYIIQFLNICGIVSNSFIIAFTSTWGSSKFDNNENRLVFAAIFEHVLLFAWILMIRFWPDMSYEEQLKRKQNVHYSKEIMISAKSLKDKKYLSAIISKLVNYGDNEPVTSPSISRLPKLDETLNEEDLEEMPEENKKRK